jgi:purine-binding chemotaxis protein CheW
MAGVNLQAVRRPSGLAVLCRVGSRICAVPAEEVSETMRPLPIEALAGAPDFVLGLSVIRGAAVPVIDAGKLLGAAVSTPPTRFVTIRAGERTAALAVDGVVGIVSLEPDSWAELSPLLRDASAQVVDFIGTHDAELLLVLRAARVVPPSLWAVLDQGRVCP